MSVEERASATDRVLAARERYVARGVSTPSLVVDRAEGMRVWDVDGREFLDFAGGIACQNLGHGPSAVVAAVHEQVDRYLHQCFMVGTYEPYVELCRRLHVGRVRQRPPVYARGFELGVGEERNSLDSLAQVAPEFIQR